jgi:hypothetical protein
MALRLSLALPWDGNEDTYKPSTFLYDANVARFNSLVTLDLSVEASPAHIAEIQPHALAAKA